MITDTLNTTRAENINKSSCQAINDKIMLSLTEDYQVSLAAESLITLI